MAKKTPSHSDLRPRTVSQVLAQRNWRDQWAETLVTEPRKWIERAKITHQHAQRKCPLIGVNCDVFEQDGLEYCWIISNYYRVMKAVGANVVLLPPTTDERLLQQLDGLLMIGGRDLDPRRDGYQLHASHRMMQPCREKFDRRLIADAMKLKLPLLAIGVGMQTLNVVLGGTLAYHIPEDFPGAPAHAIAGDLYHGHSVYCRHGSLCEAIYPKSLTAHIRSQHHQAVDDVCDGFVPTAWAEHGIVESIESVIDNWPAIGIQWHAEFPTAIETDRLIFDYFAGIASERRR